MLRQRGHALLGFAVEKPDILEDSLHAQLRKAAQAIAAELERGGFKVQAWDVFEDQGRAGVALELESFHVNEREVHLGPPVQAQPHAERFRAKWTGNPRALSAVTEERGRLVVARRREFTNAGALVRAKVEELDIGKDLGAMARAKGFEVLDPEACLTRLDKVFLTRFISRAKPWER
jgi:tRNA nucleotidyltransferase (CCA-adding enzyme)